MRRRGRDEQGERHVVLLVRCRAVLAFVGWRLCSKNHVATADNVFSLRCVVGSGTDRLRHGLGVDVLNGVVRFVLSVSREVILLRFQRVLRRVDCVSALDPGSCPALV